MIAHKKQFKIAGAIWLVIVMTFCQIVPAFASLATDDSGNWVPDSFVARWTIYNVDTEDYEIVTVTSELTSSGLTFYFPYNIYGVKSAFMSLHSSSNFDLSSLYIEGSVYYDSDLTGTTYLTSFSSYNASFFYSDALTRVYLTTEDDYPNPFSYLLNPDFPYNSVNRFYFNFSFSPTLIDGYIIIKFSRFLINSEDITPLVTVQNLDNASEDLGDLADELAVPTPDIDTIFNGMEDSISYIDDDNYQSTYSFFQNDTGIMATYITIVLAMATLGYILFGKRSA